MRAYQPQPLSSSGGRPLDRDAAGTTVGRLCPTKSPEVRGGTVSLEQGSTLLLTRRDKQWTGVYRGVH